MAETVAELKRLNREERAVDAPAPESDLEGDSECGDGVPPLVPSESGDDGLGPLCDSVCSEDWVEECLKELDEAAEDALGESGESEAAEDGDRSDAASEAETPIPDTYQAYQVYQVSSRGLKHTFSPLIRTGCVFHT